MGFDEGPEAHCACCRAWEERVAGLESRLALAEDVVEAANETKKIRQDMFDFDGDKRGMAEALDEAEQKLDAALSRRSDSSRCEGIKKGLRCSPCVAAARECQEIPPASSLSKLKSDGAGEGR